MTRAQCSRLAAGGVKRARARRAGVQCSVSRRWHGRSARGGGARRRAALRLGLTRGAEQSAAVAGGTHQIDDALLEEVGRQIRRQLLAGVALQHGDHARHVQPCRPVCRRSSPGRGRRQRRAGEARGAARRGGRGGGGDARGARGARAGRRSCDAAGAAPRGRQRPHAAARRTQTRLRSRLHDAAQHSGGSGVAK